MTIKLSSQLWRLRRWHCSRWLRPFAGFAPNILGTSTLGLQSSAWWPASLLWFLNEHELFLFLIHLTVLVWILHQPLLSRVLDSARPLSLLLVEFRSQVQIRRSTARCRSLSPLEHMPALDRGIRYVIRHIVVWNTSWARLVLLSFLHSFLFLLSYLLLSCQLFEVLLEPLVICRMHRFSLWYKWLL